MLSAARDGRLSSAAHYSRRLASQIKGTDDFCQPSDAVWQMSQHLLSPWFIGLEWPQPRGGTHQKEGQALAKGKPANASSSKQLSSRSLAGPHILLLVIVWPSAVFFSLFDYAAKQTWNACQLLSPSFCPANSSPLCALTSMDSLEKPSCQTSTSTGKTCCSLRTFFVYT